MERRCQALWLAWEAGGEGLMGGVSQFAMAGILDASGNQVFGRCFWPSGEQAAREGDHIQLNW